MGKERMVIVGGGPAATAFLHHLAKEVKQGNALQLEITVIDPNASFGPGLAYRTEEHCHLLNTVPARMSIDADNSNHFLNWLNSNRAKWPHISINAEAFFPRKLYGEYLEQQFNSAVKLLERRGVSVTRITGEVIARSEAQGAEQLRVQLPDGATELLLADKVVLATGNPPPKPIERLEGHPHYINDVWGRNVHGGGISAIPKDAHVTIIGVGLTAIDALRTLKENGHTGGITVISKTGKFPEAYKIENRIYTRTVFTEEAVKQFTALTADSYRNLLEKEIAEAEKRGFDVHSVVDSLKDYTEQDEKRRGITQPSFAAFWALLPDEEKVNWNRQHGSWFNKWLFRVPPESHEAIRELFESGQATLKQGGVDSSFTPDPNSWYINCTGPSMVENGFIAHLLESRVIAEHPAGGLRADKQLCVSANHPVPYYGVGPLFWGERFETVPVYSIGRQAGELAKTIYACFKQQPQEKQPSSIPQDTHLQAYMSSMNSNQNAQSPTESWVVRVSVGSLARSGEAAEQFGMKSSRWAAKVPARGPIGCENAAVP